ncbi:lipase member H-like isoform X2 [Atheta coriaria]|uniref:lipase member H-like isoform X2 n=1 Tax=Dalotia coriaria TaxID=877792 RepID=UPI0031F42BEA
MCICELCMHADMQGQPLVEIFLLAQQDISASYLQRKDYNVILLQAQRMEAGPWYLTAARNTRVVGEYTATFIDYLVSRGMDLNSVHLIGLSLGAQMAGVCGQNVKSGRIQRITGLDPAGPLFTKWPKSLKLDAGDAEFVDIIHTDAGIFGYPRSIGHVDFWPNRGQSPQPGCRLEEVKRRSPDAFLIEPLFCSHWRSYQFYAESVITPDSFLAVNCKNWGRFLRGDCKDNQQVNMGINVPPDARGSYFLQTRDVSPFSLQSEVPQRQLQQYAIPHQQQQLEHQENVKQHENQVQVYLPPQQYEQQVVVQEAPVSYEQHEQYQQPQHQQLEQQQLQHQQPQIIENYVHVQQNDQNQHLQQQQHQQQQPLQHPMLNFYYYQN